MNNPTQTNETLMSLAARVEEATGADRELEAEIIEAFGWRRAGGFWLGEHWERGKDTIWRNHIPRCTASLDAAMALADGLERFGGAGGMLREAMDRMSALPVMLSQMDPDEYRRTLARFFTAACLRAHSERTGCD